MKINNKINDKINDEIENELSNICNNKIKKNILILSGGGMKGISLLGAIKYLEENNIIDNIDTFIGTSIGGIICILLIIGYKSTDIYKFSEIFDMSNIIDIDINSLFTKFSINNDNVYNLIFDKLLESKNIDPNITLIEFYKKTKKKIICTTACIITKEVEYISYENYPELPLKLLYKMTSAIPLLLPPVEYNNKLYVDGGLIDNFPISIIDESKLENVIGIDLKSDYYKNTEINNIINYFITILQIVSIRLMRKYDPEKYKNIIYTINIELNNPFNFNLTKEIKKELFYKGYHFMKKNFII
jgi:predicted acylesterase/phospholipase RssA